jgi:phosphoserine phosphatase
MLPGMDTPGAGSPAAAAAFFDLDKTIISRSSTLAFVPSLYRQGLISRAQAIRGAIGQLVFRAAGADHKRMERIKEQASALFRGWSVERVTEIVYAEARGLLDEHRAAGGDVFIVSPPARR